MAKPPLLKCPPLVKLTHFRTTSLLFDGYVIAAYTEGETIVQPETMAMKTYNFKVLIEPDEDFDGNPSGWHAHCPALERLGGSTWGETREVALKNINDVVHMIVESMLEHGEAIPQPADQVEVTVEPRVAVTV